MGASCHETRQSCALCKVLLALATILVSQSAFAQLRVVGSISGTVQDSSSAVVPDAKVVLKDEGAGIVKESKTSIVGTFLFPDLGLGSYQVTVTAAGFRLGQVNHIGVSTRQTA